MQCFTLTTESPSIVATSTARAPGSSTVDAIAAWKAAGWMVLVSGWTVGMVGMVGIAGAVRGAGATAIAGIVCVLVGSFAGSFGGIGGGAMRTGAGIESAGETTTDG